jgi:hypothetical protein
MEARNLPLQAICPRTGERKTVRVPMVEVVIPIHKNGPQCGFFELLGDATPDLAGSSVAECLLKPGAILGGVREHQSGGFCYCTLVSQRWTNGGNKVPPPPGMVFTVFVNPRDWVYHWRWNPADPRDLRLPRGWDDPRRFNEGIVWPKTFLKS